MSVYFGNKSNSVKESPKTIFQEKDQPAHEKIGNLYSQVLVATKANFLDLNLTQLRNLGIDPNDTEATSEMCQLLNQLDDNTLQVSPLASGIFLIKKKDPTSPTNGFKEIAVFKVGRKRAAMESSARQLAHLLGLSKHMIAGMYCTMIGLPVHELVKDEVTTEDLWSGTQKEYKLSNETQTTVSQSTSSDVTQSSDEQNASNKSTSSDFTRTSDEQNATNKSTSSDFTRTSDEENATNKSTSSDFTRTSEEENTSNKSASSDFTRTTEEENTSNKSASSDFTRTSDEENGKIKSFNETSSSSFDDKTPAIKTLRPPETFLGDISWDSVDELNSDFQSLALNNKKENLGPEQAAFSTACAVVGIVQPFLCEEKEADLYEFTLMTIAALAIGLRDGKNDGFKGSMLFDIEDNFPMRIDPIYNKNGHMFTSCALDLPYLDQDGRTKQKLTHKQVVKLYELVSQWNIVEIISKMKKLEILYMDTACEKMTAGKSLKDEGNNEVKIIKGVEHQINGRLNALHDNPKNRILRSEQLNATNTRLSRIRDFITERALAGKPFSPEDLLDAVDIAGKIYKKRIIAEAKTISASSQFTINTSGPHHVTGRVSPEQANLKSPITQEDVTKKTRAALESATGCNKGSETPKKSINPLTRPINMTRHPLNDLSLSMSPIDGSPIHDFSFSVSPIDDNLNFTFVMGDRNTQHFTNSPNALPQFDWDISPIGSPNFSDMNSSIQFDSQDEKSNEENILSSSF